MSSKWIARIEAQAEEHLKDSVVDELEGARKAVEQAAKAIAAWSKANEVVHSQIPLEEFYKVENLLSELIRQVEKIKDFVLVAGTFYSLRNRLPCFTSSLVRDVPEPGFSVASSDCRHPQASKFAAIQVSIKRLASRQSPLNRRIAPK